MTASIYTTSKRPLNKIRANGRIGAFAQPPPCVLSNERRKAILTLAPNAIGETTAKPFQPLDFETEVRLHKAMVFSLALHFLRDRAIAEETAQEVFLELYLHLNDIQSPDHLRFWLRKVASRRCIDQSRRRKIRAQISLADAPEPSWLPAVDPLLRQYVGQLVASLGDVPRMVVILRYQEDLSPTEIAALLDMPLATVKSHLQRSLALLRQKVEPGSGGLPYGV